MHSGTRIRSSVILVCLCMNHQGLLNLEVHSFSLCWLCQCPTYVYTWRTLYMHKCIGKEMDAGEEGLKLTGAVYEHTVHT